MRQTTNRMKASADDLTKTAHKGDVELTEEQLSKVSGGDKNKHVDHGEIVITKTVDKASPNLY